MCPYFGSSGLELGWFSVPITALWIIGITNAFNLIDGLDGLATGLATIVACSSAAVFFLCGNVQEAVLLFILIGALLGFLPYNFNPATIFLGDSGSMFLGYVLAVAAVNGTQKSPKALAVMIPLLIFGLPIVDTLLSMARRFVGSLQLFRSCKVSLKERFLSASVPSSARPAAHSSSPVGPRVLTPQRRALPLCPGIGPFIIGSAFRLGPVS